MIQPIFFALDVSTQKITGVEDRDLGKRFAMACIICHINALVARIRIGMEGSTTNWSTLAEGERISRENPFNLQGSFARLWSSVIACKWRQQIRQNYWRGRLFSAYIASLVWNLKRGSRLLGVKCGVSAVAFTNWRIFTLDYWRGLMQTDLIAGWLKTSKSDMSKLVQGTQLLVAKDDGK